MVCRAGALVSPTGYFTRRYKSSIRYQMCEGALRGILQDFL